MTHGNQRAAFTQAAFRSCLTGAVIATGACHDITQLPGGLDADLGEWQAGFTDASGRFMDRREAAAAAGHTGRLEARSYFAGEATPTLEDGHVECWRCTRRPGMSTWPTALLRIRRQGRRVLRSREARNGSPLGPTG